VKGYANRHAVASSLGGIARIATPLAASTPARDGYVVRLPSLRSLDRATEFGSKIVRSPIRGCSGQTFTTCVPAIRGRTFQEEEESKQALLWYHP